MKRIIKILLVCFITVFSFYYTNKIIELSRSTDPIMIKIKEVSKYSSTKPVEGIISNDTIILGKSGKKIDINTSYEKMKKLKKYNEPLLEYINIKPTINKKNNYDKSIIGTYTNKKEISIIFRTNDIDSIKQIIYIINKNKIKTTFYIDGLTIENNQSFFKENLNKNIKLGIYGYNDIYNINSVKYVKRILNNNKYYTNYCLYKNSSFLKACKYFEISTIKPYIIDNNLYDYLKSNKKSGTIYEIEATKNNIKELNSTIIYLKQKGYSFKSIDKLLKE